MLEIPESTIISHQVETILSGKTIREVVEATSPHRFAWYNGSVEQYSQILEGQEILSSKGHGAFISIHCTDDVHIAISDGVRITYYPTFEERPKKHQLLIEFDDRSCIAFTVSMYGVISVFKGDLENEYYRGSLTKLSPLDDDFNEEYFNLLFANRTKDISIKALLATEQRIPGLGNGVLQDILFSAGIHPKRKISKISSLERSDLFHCLKTILQKMIDRGGRDTEKDFYGNKGRYKTILSKNTYKDPCPNCGDAIIKEAYLGGSIYYCPICQV